MLRAFWIAIVVFLLMGCTPSVNGVGMDEGGDSNNSLLPTIQSVEELANSGQLERADDEYLRLRNHDTQGEQMSTLELELARAHMEAGEYLLATFYAKNVLRGGAGYDQSANAAYIMVKSLFKRYEKNPSDESMGERFVKIAKSYQNNYYSSEHSADVDYLLSEYQMTRDERYERLAQSYENQGKPQAAEFYRNKIGE